MHISLVNSRDGRAVLPRKVVGKLDLAKTLKQNALEAFTLIT